MSVIETPFLLPTEVDKISRVTDMTRMRLEKSGRFPKRIKIGSRKIAWRRSDIVEWAADPEGWAKRHCAAPETAAV
jgi:predicted DNA-binding transcriptional regulator AlpA